MTKRLFILAHPEARSRACQAIAEAPEITVHLNSEIDKIARPASATNTSGPLTTQRKDRFMAKADLSADRLRELLDYNPETGVFVRRVDPRSDRPSRFKAGTVAGGATTNGYFAVTVDGYRYSAHRLAWFYVHGEWPIQIDHINGLRSDNRISNLRPATNKQNCENKGPSPRNSIGVKGVSYDARKKKWRARITHNYKEIWLGYYSDLNAASNAYIAAAKRFFTHACIP